MSEGESRVRLRCPTCKAIVATVPPERLAETSVICPHCGVTVRPPLSLTDLFRRWFGRSGRRR